MSLTQILIVMAGALAGGFVNGLTGFGTGITAIGIWLYAVSPPIAASLAVACSVIAQIQTLPMIWRSIEWPRLLPFAIPGLVGIPLGTWALSHTDPRHFKIGVGVLLVAYAAYALLRGRELAWTWGGRGADGTIGFAGGVLGGLAGLSGVLLVIWTDVRGYAKAHRRSILQAFNLGILAVAFASHAAYGFITREAGLAILIALPGTLLGAWAGTRVYMRLGDRGFQRAVMVLLLVSGVVLVWTSLR